jgi:flavin reductase (DIM6/NTAB) family NADH-FMN oxidoreductase RutF
VDGGTAARVAQLFATGAAIVVATTDEAGRAAITRGWGGSVSHAGYVTVCVAAPPDSATRSNVRANGRIAVTVVDPTTYASAQVKGIVDTVREPSDAEHDQVEAHVLRFGEAVAGVGLAGAECLMLGDLETVGFRATEVYDQTPGGHAGQALA